MSSWLRAWPMVGAGCISVPFSPAVILEGLVLSPPHSFKVSLSTLEASCLLLIFGHFILVHEIALGNVVGYFYCKIRRFCFGVECRIGMTF